MKKHIKYLLFVFLLQFVFLFSVNALTESDLTISKANNKVKVSYSDVFDTLNDAKKSVKEFKNYLKKKNGTTTVAKIDTTIESIDSEILASSFEVADLNEINAKVAELQASYDAQATNQKSCQVIVGLVEQIDTPVTTYEEENGVIGEYSDALTANIVSYLVQLYNNREDYAITTNVDSETTLVSTDIHSFNEVYDTYNIAQLSRLSYQFFGYDISNVNISEGIVTDVTTETKDFDSVEEAKAYKQQLENQGFRVQDNLLAINSREEETDHIDIDEDFDSISSLNNYLRNLNNNYNHVDVNLTDNSHDEEVSETVTQDGFSSETEAQDYIDGLRNSNDLVYNESISSYSGSTIATEDIVKYFLSEANANNYLTNLVNSLAANESITSSSVRKLSLSEIDMADVLAKGDTGLSNSTSTYQTLTINSNNTSIFNNLNIILPNGTRNGRISRIDSVTVNGTQLTRSGFGGYTYRLNSGSIPNNAKVVISGVITYRNGFANQTANFTAEGILNRSNNNSNSRTNFEYSISSVNVNNGTATVEDNLVDIFVVNATKSTETPATLYRATANIYRKRTITSYNLSGEASNINTIPIMTVEFIKEKDRTVYNLQGDAIRNNYQTTYIVRYNAIRTIRSIATTYRQNYTVMETTNIPHFLVTAEGYYNENNNTTVSVPNTGVYEKNDKNYSYILVIISSIIIGLFIKLRLTNDN